MEYHIKEVEWNIIYKFLCTCKGLHKNEKRLRLFIEAIWHVARSGCQWRLLSGVYGNWNTIHKRFKRWVNQGIWNLLFQHVQIDPDLEIVMLDGTIVRAHACAAGYSKNSQAQEALGRSAGGFSTKIHTLVDALGYPLLFFLTGGQRHEITQSEILVADIRDTIVTADKAYDSDRFINLLIDKACIPVIPSRRNRKQPREYDQHIYKERHLIECFFGKIKHFRRIATRFDKAAKTYLSFLQFASTFIWLR